MYFNVYIIINYFTNFTVQINFVVVVFALRAFKKVKCIFTRLGATRVTRARKSGRLNVNRIEMLTVL